MTPTTPPQTTPQLLAECHRLIEQISRQPYNTKRLLAARAALQQVVSYKNRPNRFSKGSEPP